MNEKQAKIFGAVLGVVIVVFFVVGSRMGFLNLITVHKWMVYGALPVVVIFSLVGTYFGIKRAKSPQWRRFAIQKAISFWGIFMPCFFIFIFVDFTYKVVIPIFMLIFMYKWTSWMKKKQRKIEASEQQEIGETGR